MSHLCCGSRRAGKGQFREAVTDYDSAILLDPSNHQGTFQRSSAHLAVKEFGKAIDDAKAALGADQSNALYKAWLSRVLEARAIELAQKGKLPEAITDYTEALRLEPDNVVILMARATTRAAMGTNGEAVADYSDVLRVRPDSSMRTCVAANSTTRRVTCSCAFRI